MADRAAEGLGLRTGRGSVLRSFLDRFRRTPAVPTAVGDTLGAELAPLFAVLDRLAEEAEEARRMAALRAQAGLGDVAEEVEAILTSARERAEDERAETLRTAQRRADAEVRRTLAAARADAEEVRRREGERAARLVDEVVVRIRDFRSADA